MASDQELVLFERLRARDPLGIERLYDAYGRRAFGLAYQLVGERGAAEDIVQEAFLSLWQHSERLQPGRGHLLSLLLTIVHHKAIDRLRREQNEARPTADLVERAGTAGTSDPAEMTLRSIEKGAVLA